ncbi:molybdopterin molybdenumtransferase MoeA [Rhizocola hellebori]|uniref:Molybdopterin molybdenumtransferase n=1 Tax=Rhizocola hellebori TaxID=1392758 RepID=A0A8J3VD05_9ACTN|nr:molybdopterin molybdenumtransferase MoeA [Rhizocola hellebori]
MPPRADGRPGRLSAGMGWRPAYDLAATAGAPTEVQRIPVADAVGRVLAADLVALVALPGFDTSAMDGFAVAGAGPWRLVGRVLAGGAPHADVLGAGTAVEIATGAMVPAGTRAVLPVEVCRCEAGVVTGSEPGRSNIRLAGEDVLPGQVLAEAGAVAGAALAGLAAQAGLDELAVWRPPLVRIVVTGDELVFDGLPDVGKIRDALGPLVCAVVTRAGAVVADVIRVRDDAAALADALLGGQADVVVVTGSSSVGRADHLHPVLDRLGARMMVDGVACRPGHPQLLARNGDGRWVVGLPGNPYAGLVGCLTLLEPLLGGLAGRTRRNPLMLPLSGDPQPAAGWTRLVPVLIDGGHATVVAASRPASLVAAATADAVAVVEPEWHAGQPVWLLPLQ